jgi:phosphate transport system ATP-binding protein
MSLTVENNKQNIKIQIKALNLYYGAFHALENVNMAIEKRKITAIIGPSGCGKSTLLRVFNRMNDLIPSCKVEGEVLLDGKHIYEKSQDVVELRKKVGMVFQKPNVFPMSVYENIIIGPKRHGITNKRRLNEIAERSLSRVALWDELKDSLNKPGPELPAGAQQRLCIARAIAVEPEVILMDESCSALDPESTMKVEDLMLELAKNYTIIIVTHNMEQARRVSDMSAFMMLNENKVGSLHEYRPTIDMFANPKSKITEDYITGRFG